MKTNKQQEPLNLSGYTPSLLERAIAIVTVKSIAAKNGVSDTTTMRLMADAFTNGLAYANTMTPDMEKRLADEHEDLINLIQQLDATGATTFIVNSRKQNLC